MSTILIVEDEAQVAASLRDLLEREGYTVRVAGSIAEARLALADRALALDGKPTEAIAMLARINTAAQEPRHRVILEATRGLAYFRSGRIEEGRVGERR